MKMNFKRVMKSISLALVPMFFLGVLAGEASAKNVSGRASFGNKVGKCYARISGSKRTTVTCIIGGLKKKFSVQPKRSKIVRLKKKSKYKFRISGVRKSSSKLTFLVTAYKGRKKKQAQRVTLR